MDLLKVSFGKLDTTSTDRRELFGMSAGLPDGASDGSALVDLRIAAGSRLPGAGVRVGFASVFGSALATAATNALVGYLTGTASNLVTQDHFTSLGGSVEGVFACLFVTDAVVRELYKAWTRSRSRSALNGFIDKGRAEAIFDSKDGVWLVGRDGAYTDTDAKVGRQSQWLSFARNEFSVLSVAEFRAFEQRVASAGAVLRMVRLDPDDAGMELTTYKGGRLESVDGNPAYSIFRDGVAVTEEWYLDGRRVPRPVDPATIDRDHRVLLATWNASGSLDAEAAILRAALAEMRDASKCITSESGRDEAAQGRQLLAQADSLLRSAFGIDESLELQINNFDGLAQWPDETAERFKATALTWLDNAMARLETRLATLAHPAVEVARRTLLHDLQDRGYEGVEVVLRVPETGGILMSAIYEGDRLLEVVRSEDVMFGHPGWGVVLKSGSIAWHKELDVALAVDQARVPAPSHSPAPR